MLMYTESTYTGIALITPMNALTFCDVLYQISSSDEPDAMYTFATGMQLVFFFYLLLLYIITPRLSVRPSGCSTFSRKP